MYSIFDGRETYTVNEKQQITRNKMEWMKPSGSWLALAIVKYNNFGNMVEHIPFDQWDQFLETNPQMKYKNGKPMYHLVDFDHGSNRIWGHGIHNLWKKEA